MTPVTNKPPMPQAPGKGIKSFPTPVIDDVVITEVVNAWKGDYRPLDYGVKWDEVPHASMQGSHPDHKLVFQDPASSDGEWIKRIWANDRVNQDSYNYAIKYSGGSQSHPIYIRTYVLPRDGYVPLPDLTPDDVYPTALLVEEEVQRNEGELDSKYIKVVRVFETLQGPEISSVRYNERGDLEEIINQQVSPNTPPDPDGLFVTQSQVIKEDVSKGTKTTATVPSHSTLTSKEKKEGLLGETFITDDIVDPTTSPDALSTTVISSSVEQTSKTKARKRTVTSTGPTSLSKKNKDGKLLGDTDVVRSVVAPNTLPDLLSTLILSSEVDQTDSGKAIKTNIVLNSTPKLKGSKQSQGLLGTTTTQEEVVSAGSLADSLTLKIVSSQVEPIDSVRSRKVTETSTGPITLSGASSKDGLLGQTEIVETIVPYGSPADTLSTDIISSEITPIDSAKSKKTTIKLNGPTSLSKLNQDGKLLGNTKITRSVVAPNTLPDVPSSLILSSEIDQTDSGKAIKTNIVLNSTPILKGSKQSQGLLGTTTTQETVVAAGTIADTLTRNIVSSQVEPIDSVRSRKVTETATGPLSLSGDVQKQGLLGRTQIKETIVNAGSAADSLSKNVISSEVTPIDYAKSKKTTVWAVSPFSLKTTSLASTPLGLVSSQKEESIVETNITASGDIKVLSDEIIAIDESKNKRETITVDAWPTLRGIEYDEALNVGFFYEKQIIDPSDYKSSTNEDFDGDPLDEWKTLKKKYDVPQIQSVLESQYYKIDTSVNIQLPNKLKEVTAYFGLSHGQGSDNSEAAGAGDSYNYSMTSSARSSSSVSGDLYFKVEKGFSGNAPAIEHIFFIKTSDGTANSVSNNSILTILNNFDQFSSRSIPGASTTSTPNDDLPEKATSIVSKYSNWPSIKMVSENVVLIGGSKSKSTGNSESASQSLNGSATAIAKNTSFDVNVSANSVVVPETLHGPITITKHPIGSLGDIDVPYSVNPPTLEATVPDVFPTGHYLMSSTVSIYKFGFCKVSAITVEIKQEHV